jgi:hypothetical protein
MYLIVLFWLNELVNTKNYLENKSTKVKSKFPEVEIIWATKYVLTELLLIH